MYTHLKNGDIGRMVWIVLGDATRFGKLATLARGYQMSEHLASMQVTIATFRAGGDFCRNTQHIQEVRDGPLWHRKPVWLSLPHCVPSSIYYVGKALIAFDILTPRKNGQDGRKSLV